MEDTEWQDYEDALKDLINLEYLSCVSRAYELFFPFKLHHLSNLKWLQLEFYDINQAFMKSISKNLRISVLKFKDCRFERLKNGLFTNNMPSLRVLEIDTIYLLKFSDGMQFSNKLNEKMEYLCLKNCRVEKEVSIFKMPNLKYLDLSESGFERSLNIFKDLNNLEELSFSIRSPDHLDALKGLKLDEIYLSNLSRLKLNCGFISLPIDTFVYLKHLKSLILNDFQIDNLQNGLFSQLFRLEQLTIKGIIKQLGENVFKGLENLKILILEENKIEEICPNAFTSLKKLEKLNLSRNMIQQLQQGVFSSLTFLKNLYLEHNLLTCLEDNLFDGLEKLEILDLSSNKIKNLGGNQIFNCLNQLKELNSAFNQIDNLEDGIFSHLSSLEILGLEGNGMKVIRKGIFQGLQNLTKLDLSEIEVEELSADSFDNLNHLKELYLSRNRIQILVDGAFCQLRSLQVLDLSSNPIKRIERNAFENLDCCLRELNLTSIMICDNNGNDAANNLEEVIIFDAFKGLKRLEILYIDKYESEKQRKEFEKFFGKNVKLSFI